MRTITNEKKDIYEMHDTQFQKVFTNLRVTQVKDDIADSEYSAKDMKNLALEMVEHAKTLSISDTNQFLDMVELWSAKLKKGEWKEELIEYCKERHNIAKLLIASKNGCKEFIIIMDDSTDDSVLEYNEYAFEVRKKYDEISDFMILDINTSKGIEYMYDEIDMLYERR